MREKKGREEKGMEGKGRGAEERKRLHCLYRKGKKKKDISFYFRIFPLMERLDVNKMMGLKTSKSSPPFCYPNKKISILPNYFLSFPSIFIYPNKALKQNNSMSNNNHIRGSMWRCLT